MTTVVYNGVEIHNCLTREFDSETVYDPSGTDIIGRRVRFTWQGLLHSQNVPNAPTFIGIAGIAGDATPAGKIAWLHERLSTPRAELSVYSSVENHPPGVGDNARRYFRAFAATEATQNNAAADTDNGPKPTKVQITQIANSVVFRVVFSIEVQFSHCLKAAFTPNDNQAGRIEQVNPVVSNRWSVSESMDGNYFMTRRITGHIRIRNALQSVHIYRAECVPPLEAGFRRESLDFDESENGLEGTYTVTDRQVHNAAPWPLTKFEATHEESTHDSLEFSSSMRVAVWGDPSTRKSDMLVRAVQIADARLQFTKQENQNSFLYRHVAIIDVIGEENRLELHVSLQSFRKTQRASFDLMAKSIAQPLDLPELPNAQERPDNPSPKYDPRISRRPAIFGYDPQTGPRNPVQSFLLHCYLHGPCDKSKAIWPGEDEKKPKTPPTEPPPKKPEVTGSVVSEVTPPAPADRYSDTHAEAMYTSCRLTSRYAIDTYRAHMPLAFSPSNKTAAFATLTNGVTKRIIDVDCERVGKPPAIPNVKDVYKDGDVNYKLLSHWIDTYAPTLTATGDKQIIRITAHYVYGADQIFTANDKLRVGVLPFTSFKIDDTSLTLKEAYNEEVGP